MALIKCPECGKEISSKAFSCPSCGYLLTNNNQILKETEEQSEQEKINNKGKAFKIFFVLTIICIVSWAGMYLWQQSNASDITSARASGYASSMSWMTGISSHQSETEKNLVKIDNFVKVAERVLIILIIIFVIISIYYYNSVSKLKRRK